MSKKNKIILLTIGVVCLLTIIIGLSYSYFVVSHTQEEENSLVSACFKFEFTDENDINLTNSKPILEKRANDLTPYTFTVSNICNFNMEYSINIETLNNTTMDLNAVRFKINSDQSQILGTKNDNDPSMFLNENVSNSKTIKTGFIGANKAKTFYLRMWIDEDATIDQSAEKIFESKVVVFSKMIKEGEEPSTLVSGPVLNEIFKKLAYGEAIEEQIDEDKVEWFNEMVEQYSIFKELLGENGQEKYNDMIENGELSPDRFSNYEEAKLYATKEMNSNPSLLFYLIDDINKYNMVDDESITSIQYTTNEPNPALATEIISTEDSPSEVVAWFEDGTIYIHSSNNNIKLNSNFSLTFYQLYGLRNIDLSHFDSSDVEQMAGTFSSTYVKSDYFNNFDMSNVKNTNLLFVQSVVDIDDLSVIDTSNVTDMNYMFFRTFIKNGNFGRLNTSNVENMAGAFSNINKITQTIMNQFYPELASEFTDDNPTLELDFTGINTSKVKDMQQLFSGTTGVSNLDLKAFDTSNVIDMTEMFKKSNFTILDLSSFNTSNVLFMDNMFLNSKSLQTIIVGDNWIRNSNLSSDSMFEGASSLVGGAGTLYSSSNIDAVYAQVDCSVSHPGYFTYYTSPTTYCENYPGASN